MKIGPKYKIARRLGAPIFEKTQTQKYALRLGNKKQQRGGRRPGSRSQYSVQVAEKQKARFTYGITEKQLTRYVNEAVGAGTGKPVENLYQKLETRLDSLCYVLGFASTRRAARQMTSHGHITVNGRKVTIPSYHVSVGDVISFRKGSETSPLFDLAKERVTERAIPGWVTFDMKKMEATVKSEPAFADAGELLFDLEAIIEFYSR